MALAKVAAIIGVGPGIGSAVAQKFAKEGFNVALVSRSADKLASLASTLQNDHKIKAVAYSADASKCADVIDVVKKIKSDLGNPQVLIYNAAFFKMSSIANASLEDYELALNTLTLGGIAATKQVLPAMLEAKSGTIIFTGATASLRGGANFSLLGVAKAAMRSFAQSLAREVHPQGVHVAHVVLDGIVNVPGSQWIDAKKAANGEYIEPSAVADAYWQLHTQDKTIWSQEIELRPYTEKF